jgi:hypothetical protein
MKSNRSQIIKQAVLRTTGKADEPKGPSISIRLPQSLSSLVEGRTSPETNRADVITDLVRKGLRYERLRQTKGDPALGELVALVDEMLASRLTEATTQLYTRVSFDCLLLKRLLEEVHGDARVSSSAAERLLTGRVLTPPHVLTERKLEEFLSECQEGAASVVAEIQEEWQKEGDLKLGRRPMPDVGSPLEHQPSPSAGQLPAPAPTTPDAAAR